ncbi:hypothetical protein PC121_g24889, partial [Phytophthora cactorum]
MFSASFADYVPALSAHLNASVDSKCKSWRSVVEFFFEMNKDAELSRVATLAATFANLPHPNYLRIRAVE